MLFKSAEIRWFFSGAEIPKNAFHSSLSHMQGEYENLRADLYLRTNLNHTGVKIREGKHELKLKSKMDITYKDFLLQSWNKWSYSDDKSIVDLIAKPLLDDWIAIEKSRWIKKVSISDNNELIPISNERVSKGCTIELTEINIENQQILFSYGLEAFSQDDSELDILKLMIDKLEKTLLPLKTISPSSYPELLVELNDKTDEEKQRI